MQYFTLRPLYKLVLFKSLAVLLFVAPALNQSQLAHAQDSFAGLDTLQLRTIFAEPFLPGVRPSIINFSPIGNHVHFSWNDSSYAETGQYRVNLNGELLEKVEDDDAPTVRSAVSPNRASIAYTRNNVVFVANMDGTGARQVFSANGVSGNPHWSSDSRQLAFVVNGDVWTLHLENSEVRQVTRRDSDEPRFFIRGWALNDSKLILQQTDTSHYAEIFFPEYVPEFVRPGGSRRGQPHITLLAADIEQGETEVLFEGGNYHLNSDISADGRYFILDVTNHDMKQRELFSYDLSTGETISLFSETTDGWIYSPLMRAKFAPDGITLFYTTEESGFSHIYTVRADGSRQNRVTSGDFEIDWVEWAGANTLVYSSTERDPGLRDLYTININTRSRTRLTQEEAFRYDYRLSPDMRYIAYMKTTWNQPGDLYLLDIRRPDREVRLTNSIPGRFKEVEWQQPDYYRFMGRDSTVISMDVLKPHGFVEGGKYPVVVFVHGAGSLQNVFQGWSRSYPREYMFHQILNREGYVVVEVDFRHSTGYGRAFREDVTNWMGRYELNDIVDGLRFLDENYGYLDMENIGIYGGSYGGFMALYALSHEPEIFSAGAALRAVTDWFNYYHANPGYTRPRLGTPEDNPEHYERSSPITFADSLSRPVIILHGLIDDNVGFQDAAQYINVLIESGNTDFDMMMYPSERHAYQNPNAWHDQYLRIFNFFERHLKN